MYSHMPVVMHYEMKYPSCAVCKPSLCADPIAESFVNRAITGAFDRDQYRCCKANTVTHILVPSGSRPPITFLIDAHDARESRTLPCQSAKQHLTANMQMHRKNPVSTFVLLLTHYCISFCSTLFEDSVRLQGLLESDAMWRESRYM
jgi:hypothetical protein